MEKTYVQGFRVEGDRHGLRIEAIDYHSRPLFLSFAELSELGLVELEPQHPDPAPDPDYADAGEEALADLGRSLTRVARLVSQQEDRARWKDDLVNLMKLHLLIAGLDAELVGDLLKPGE